MMANFERHSAFFVTAGKECKQLTSLVVSRVSCLSPWARQNFPAPQKIEKKLCLIGIRKRDPTEISADTCVFTCMHIVQIRFHVDIN